MKRRHTVCFLPFLLVITYTDLPSYFYIANILLFITLFHFADHELWWLTGVYYKRHKEADTRQKVEEAIEIIVDDILSGKMVAARVLHLTSKQGKDIPVVFVHAGYHAKFLKYLTNVALDEKNGVLDPEDIVKYTNKILVDTIKKCPRYPCDKFTDEIFEAGADRGGDNVGGPL